MEKFCPKCGTERINESKYCANCGYDFLSENSTSMNVPDQNSSQLSFTAPIEKKHTAHLISVNKKKNGFVTWGIIGVVVLVGIYMSTLSLSADEKIAVRIVSNIRHVFKDPSSVRVEKVTICVDKDCVFAIISATNGFGARNSECYYISEDGYIEEDDSCYGFQNDVNIEKVNKNLN